MGKLKILVTGKNGQLGNTLQELSEDQSDISRHWKSEKQFNCKKPESKIKILYQEWLKAVEKTNT